jgi:hypothetical protein
MVRKDGVENDEKGWVANTGGRVEVLKNVRVMVSGGSGLEFVA